MTAPIEYYYNIATKQVEEGRQSLPTNLMGPYPTREAAEKALETAQARNESWDEETERWEEEWNGKEDHDR